jgi:uncharacterized protein with von Willebrand factor type A (vWA) domain
MEYIGVMRKIRRSKQRLAREFQEHLVDHQEWLDEAPKRREQAMKNLAKSLMEAAALADSLGEEERKGNILDFVAKRLLMRKVLTKERF